MTCHLVGNRQMLTVGGFSSNNLSSSCDWEVKSVAIYDMSSLVWGSVFRADAPAYQVPGLVVDVIGGRYVDDSFSRVIFNRRSME